MFPSPQPTSNKLCGDRSTTARPPIIATFNAQMPLAVAKTLECFQDKICHGELYFLSSVTEMASCGKVSRNRVGVTFAGWNAPKMLASPASTH
jgi:hypothetical protein